MIFKNFAINFIDFKTLNVCCLKTTCLNELKLMGSIEQVNKSPYIDF